MMATLEQRNHARSYLKKAEEYLASAEANLQAGRYTVAAGDAIHAGICAKDAIVTELNEVQGHPVDIGGYYAPNAAMTTAVMRPSKTFNDIQAAARG